MFIKDTRAQRLLFYEWAYGRLAAHDAKVGPLGEFLTGLEAGVLDARRTEFAPFDLRSVYGQNLEVKTTCTPRRQAGTKRKLTLWNIIDQKRALSGQAQMADFWILLAADFPAGAEQNRFFNAFDRRWWRAYLVTGRALAESGLRKVLTEGSARKRFGAVRLGLEDLNEALRRAAGETKARAAVLPSYVPTERNDFFGLKLAFFRWAYGDLTMEFNCGRLAEFQVMRIGGLPTPARKEQNATDLMTVRGRRLEVKFSATQRNVAGRTEYLVPKRKGRGGRGPARRASDAYVFCRIVATEAERASAAFDAMDLKWWRFRLVPTADLEALGNRRSIYDTRLAKLGYRELTAEGLRRELATRN